MPIANRKVRSESLPTPIDIAFLEAIPDDAHEAWLKIAHRYRLFYRKETRLWAGL
jgi:hypothetical protein